MIFTANQLVAHLVGDYVLQSHWEAQKKTKNIYPALLHAIKYTFPFMFITQSIPALLFICLSHAIIDRFRLARYVNWFKNWMWINKEEVTSTGYPDETPAWLAVWLLIITDNIIHIVLNAIAITCL